tara:strand:- start:44 stop:262 length:219 start_codon:yes stop_codon:yes gene_type:complete
LGDSTSGLAWNTFTGISPAQRFFGPHAGRGIFAVDATLALAPVSVVFALASGLLARAIIGLPLATPRHWLFQ